MGEHIYSPRRMYLLHKIIICSFFLLSHLSAGHDGPGKHPNPSDNHCENPYGVKGEKYQTGCNIYKCVKKWPSTWTWKKVKIPKRKVCCIMNGDFYTPGSIMASVYEDGCPKVELYCDEKLNTEIILNECKKCCPPVLCDMNAEIIYSTDGCGRCKCLPGWVGPGNFCGPDSDSDGWSDIALNCTEKSCAQDNCVAVPNSSQEDADGDGEGDACDGDADNDGLVNDSDNCPLISNQDQADADGDDRGDVCDNCVSDANYDQEDVDYDGIGNVCDDDMDNDGLKNADDNCAKKFNPYQEDADSDGVGDVCDICKDVADPGQEDENHNQIGDACDGGIDSDGDGIPDSLDNCPNDPNTDQADADKDGVGDECDTDKDADGIEDPQDNCPYVYNPDQADSNSNGIGNACENDCDGDSLNDEFDDCPCNADLSRTDFRGIQNISYENAWGQPLPFWQFKDEGKEIVQRVNSGPGIAIGNDKLGGVDFMGTMFVACCTDNDWIGVIFAYQDSNNFYALVSSMSGSGQGPWQVKRINSATGTVGHDLSNAIRSQESVAGQTEVLYKYSTTTKASKISDSDDDEGPGKLNKQGDIYEGWQYDTGYRFHIHHEPKIDLINVKIYVGSKMIVDTGDIIDNSSESLKGGRLGVYCDSQEEITWAQMSYRCLN